MGLFDAQDTHQALEELLMRERTAILEGDFNALEPLIAEKERLLKAIGRTRGDPGVLAKLKEQSERNAQLYDAVRAGVGTALERLRSIREPRETLRTYDPSGQKKEIRMPQSKTSHRA